MSNSIPLHPKFGLNPTMLVCFYCGETTGELALLGNKYKGEAPKYMCNSIKPCDKCKEKYKDHLLVVEVAPDNQEPTGRWVALHNSCVGEEMKKESVALCLHDEFEQLFVSKEDKVNG